MEDEQVRKEVLWVAAFLVVMGAVLIILGMFIAYVAITNLGNTLGSYSDTNEAYEAVLRGSMIETLGTIVALIGIASGFIGAALPGPRERVAGSPEMYQQMQPQYQREAIMYACPTCESRLVWVAEKQGHYCFECKEFF
jgi:hypothetical protein